MKKIITPILMGLGLLMLNVSLYAQTANVQIIHNAADPNAATVDIYLDAGAAPAVDDLNFREATNFIALPAGVSIDVGVAPGTSTGPSDILATITLPPLTAGENYIAMATGVLVPALFDQTANGADIAFKLEILTPARQLGTSTDVDLAVFHGATDVDSVDILVASAGGATLIDDLAYGTFQGYAAVAPTKYILDITPYNDNSTVVISYFVDLSTLGGGAATVFASGFLNPANNQNGPGFGVFAALADGTVLPLTATGDTADVQVIHNSGDPAADSVDIYVDILTDTIKLDNVAYRTATGFLTLPAGYPIDIVVAAKNSTSIADGLASFTPTLVADSRSLAIASGVLNLPGSSFAANPDGVDNGFTLLLTEGRNASASATDLDVTVVHGSTDAPSVGVNANGGALLDSVAYQDISGYVTIPAAQYRIDVTAANDPASVLFPFYFDASGLGGGAAAILASGFLTPADNEDGAGFGLFAVLPAGGDFVALTPVGAARAQVIHNAADPAADTVDIYVNTFAGIVKVDDFAFRTATGFIDLPAGYPVDIVIAAPTSADITDGVIATIPLTATDADTLHIIANGVLDPSGFAANPEAISTAFNLYAIGGSREAARDAGNVDLRVFHGATDAPAVDVVAFGSGVIVDSAAYTDATGYLELPAASYQLNVTPEGANSTVVGSFIADASGLGGGSGIIVASGFLTPADNADGEAFGLLLVLADGTAILLDNVTSRDRDLGQNNALLKTYPNPFRGSATLEYSVDTPGEVSFQILDMSGKVLSEKVISNQFVGEQELNLSAEELGSGMRLIIMRTETSRAVQKVLVLE
ncbi:MAG: DUF4397 domain-containing protein [Bacteroidia bacterium]|nr:DUF4397 domain-containing protein [Bacteroidia bacterium]